MGSPWQTAFFVFCQGRNGRDYPWQTAFFVYSQGRNGVAAPGKREFWRFARGARRKPTNKRHSLAYAGSSLSYESKPRRQQYFWRRTTIFSAILTRLDSLRRLVTPRHLAYPTACRISSTAPRFPHRASLFP